MSSPNLSQARRSVGLCLLAGAVGLIGCGSDSSSANPGGGTTTSEYDGTIVGTGVSGTVQLTFDSAISAISLPDRVALMTPRSSAASTTVNVTGIIKIGGSSSTITGTYDPNTHQFTVSGGGYTLTGQVTSTGIVGTFTGPNGTSGGFTALSGTSQTITVYCGTYSGAASGNWNIVQKGSTLTGVASGTSGGTNLSGGVSGTSMNITFSNGTATGTISGSNVRGTWTSSQGTGTWQGSVCS